jgi:sugar lactone lactonase YvrE
MAGMHQIWVLEGTQIRPFAGNGVEDIRDGAHEDSCFAQPSGLWIDGSLLYVADSESSAIRAIDLDRGLVYTLVGAGLFEFGDRDGECQEARLQHPLSVFTSGGIVYIADTYNNKIKSLDLESRAVQTFCEGFNEPSGMALFGDDILVADTNNHRIATVNIKSKKVSSLDLSQK